jgi:dihydrodipicolinate synthase/N-acetylneuraminate lyase
VFALPTPFTSHLVLDTGALVANLEFLTSLGAPPILLNGTTGEFPSLTGAERKVILETAARKYDGAILNHVGSCSTHEAIELLRHSEEHAAASLIVAPFYFADPPEMGLRDHFAQVARQATKPLYLYDFPRHARVSLTPSFVASLASEFPIIRGIKSSVGDIELCERYRPYVGEVFVASEANVSDTLRRGFAGIIAGGANPVPEYLLSLAAEADGNGKAGETANAYELWNAFRRAVGGEMIAIIKAAMAARLPGYPPFVRAPLVALDDEAQTRVRAEVAARIRR